MFDSVFCYFPITFRPPPGDPYGITARDLKIRLRECIASSGHFAPYAFPQLLEKLDSTSVSVKHDVLQTLAACASSYGRATISNFAITLWDSIKYEIFNAQEEELASNALGTLRSIATRLGQGQHSADAASPLALYLKPITKECNEKLQEPQHKQAKSAGQILGTLGAASEVAFHIVIRACFPPLSTLYQAAETVVTQRALLEVFIQILDAAIIVYGTPASPTPPSRLENPLIPFKDRLFELTSQALMSTAIEELSFRMVALQVVLRLSMLRQYLEENEIGMFVQYLDEIILSENPTGRDDLRNSAVQALVDISRIKPQLIMTITFPAFIGRLPDEASADSTEYLNTLEGLAQLSVDKFVSDTLVRRLLNRLDIVLGTHSPPAYSQAIISTIHFVLARRDLNNDQHIQDYIQRIVVGLTDKAVKACTGAIPAAALTDVETLERLGRLIALVVASADQHKQLSMANQCYSLFQEDNHFLPIPFRQPTPGAPERLTLVLTTAIIAAISPLASFAFHSSVSQSNYLRLCPNFWMMGKHLDAT